MLWSLSCVENIASSLASLLADGPPELRHYAAHGLANLSTRATSAPQSCESWGLPALAAAVGALLDGTTSSCGEEDLLRVLAHLAPTCHECPEPEARSSALPTTNDNMTALGLCWQLALALASGLSSGLRDRRISCQLWACGAMAALAAQKAQIGILWRENGKLLHLLGRTCGSNDAAPGAREHAALALGYAARHMNPSVAVSLSGSSTVVQGLARLAAGGQRVPPKARQHAVSALAELSRHSSCHSSLMGVRWWGGGDDAAAGGEWGLLRALKAALEDPAQVAASPPSPSDPFAHHISCAAGGETDPGMGRDRFAKPSERCPRRVPSWPRDGPRGTFGPDGKLFPRGP